jgi:hypothetical protein
LLTLARTTLGDGDLAHRVMTECDDEAVRNLVAELVTSELPAATDESAAVTLAQALSRQRRNQAFALQEEIDRATRANDLERLAELMQQKVLLRKKSGHGP